MGQDNLRLQEQQRERTKNPSKQEIDQLWKQNRQKYELTNEIIAATDLGESYSSKQSLTTQEDLCRAISYSTRRERTMKYKILPAS